MTDLGDVHTSDGPPTIADGVRDGLPEGETSHSPSGASRPKRILKRVLLTVLALVLAVVALAAVAYNFGSMERPSAEMQARYAELARAGQAPPAPSTALRVPIPGCKCHSDDPVQTVQHSGYAIRECQGCHDRSGPSPASAGR